jgi:hypothetical protein
MGTFAYNTSLAREHGYKYTPGQNGADTYERDNVVIVRDGISYMIHTVTDDGTRNFQTTVCSGLGNTFITARRYLTRHVCEYSAAHKARDVRAVTIIDCGPVGTVRACQACADFYARNSR